MRRPASLKLRLTLLFSIVAAIVFSSFGWIIERSIDRHFIAGDSAELEVIADTVSQALTAHVTTDNPERLVQTLDKISLGHYGAALYVTKQDGLIVYSSPGDPMHSSIDHTANGNNKNDTVYRWRDGKHHYRVLTRWPNDNRSHSYTISVAVTIDHHVVFLSGFRQTLWLMITAGIIVIALIGWIVVRQGHAPLRKIVTQIRRISANELNIRLTPGAVPLELSDLAVSFNDMMALMEEAFQRLSNFSADIAHELRTPVTSLLTQTQVALSQSRSVEEYREVLYSNIEEYEHMAQMISDMLFLAKADNGQYKPDTVDIDLSQEVKELFEYYEAWAEEKGISLALHGNATISGDRLMLRRALGNLLSNAIRHTPSGSTVRVYLEQTPDLITSITVENSGSAIPAEHIPKLFDRFYRVDASRQRSGDGAGLGLAITKSIVDIHGGKICATSSEGKTEFRITIPQSPLAIHNPSGATL